MTTSSSFLSIVSMTLVASCTILLLALDLSGPPGTPGTLNGYGYKDIYAWHPALMTLAFTLCFPIAMLSYVVELPSGWLPTKRSRRILHGACNLMGTLFSICGFVLAFTYHEALGKVHTGLSGEVGTHAVWYRPAHIILGYIVLLGIFLQCVFGLVKYVQREDPNQSSATPSSTPILSLHGKIGPLFWACGLICILLAVYFEYLEVPPQDKPHWNLTQLVISIIFVLGLFLSVSWMLATSTRIGAHQKSVDDDNDEEGSVSLLN